MASYTDEQKQTYIETAQDVGMTRAMRQLGYPGSPATATKWLKEYGVSIDVDTLKQKAADIKHFYGYMEQMHVLQTGLDRIQQMIEHDDLTAAEMRQLADAANKIIQTIELVSGRVTDRNETVTVDSTDLEIKRLIAEVEAQNQAVEEELADTN